MASFDGQPSSPPPDSPTKPADAVPQARMKGVDNSTHNVVRDAEKSSNTTGRDAQSGNSSSSNNSSSRNSSSSRDMGPLWCGLCRQVLESPRMLPQCHDSFCEKCLEKEADRQGGSSLCCPTCDAVVNLPPEGVKGFKENKYITEKQLKEERDRSKPGAASIFCDIHKDVELSLFCDADECKQPICLFCKAIEHADHKVSYLPAAADSAKEKLSVSTGRLETSIQMLRNALKQAEDHNMDAKEKAEKIKDLIKSQYAALVSCARRHRDQVLQDVDEMMKDMDYELIGNEIKIQKHLNTLLRLRNRVSDALDSTNHVEVVRVAKQVSEVEGSTRQLEAVMQSLPTKTWSPSLDRDAGALSDELFKTFFGCPVQVELPSKSPAEVILPFYQCKAPAGYNEIHFVHTTAGGSIHAVFSNMVPGFQKRQLITVKKDGVKKYGPEVLVKRWPTFDRGPSIIPQASSDPSVPGTHVIFANSFPGVSLSHTFSPPKTVLKGKLVGQSRLTAFELTGSEISLPISFDVSSTGVCILINEKQAGYNRGDAATDQGILSSRHTHPRTVKLFFPQYVQYRQYKYEENYTPRQQPFYPTAVSFLRRQDQPDVLLIADLAADAMHMVVVRDGQYGRKYFQFLRYIGAGSPYLLQPTALDTRYDTIVIGCQTGWIFTCKQLPDKDESQREHSVGQNEQCDEDASDGGCMLNVDNMSTSTTDSVHMNEA